MLSWDSMVCLAHATLSSQLADMCVGVLFITAGRAIKLDGFKKQYLQFIWPPLRCVEFTLEFWVKPGPHVQTWSRFFDVGAGTHRWLMISPKGSGWWGLVAAWNFWWHWGWVRTESLPEDMWSHVALLFGYWHVCLLVDGSVRFFCCICRWLIDWVSMFGLQYRDCRWNHWWTRNAWRYWHRWRNFVGRSQYWWDPFLSAELDEVRPWLRFKESSINNVT